VIRLFVSGPLADGGRLRLAAEQSHYLVRVMRLGLGDAVSLFNGADGQWRARIAAIGKRDCELEIEAPERAQAVGPDLELMIALVKRGPLETIVEKACELGARRIALLLTDRTNADRVNLERLSAIAVEASEQCGRLDVPAIAAPQRLAERLRAWPADRSLMFCDEAGDAPTPPIALAGAARGPWSVLIGPEGGFSPAERTMVRALPQARAVTLGPRILRADTAAIAALSLWQSALGDWTGA
jgi:16S rRNA (uracil1498-N3)-methyltransferase